MEGGWVWHVVMVGGANTDYLARGPKLQTPGTGVEGEAFYAGPGSPDRPAAPGSSIGLARPALGRRVTTGAARPHTSF